MYPLQELPYIAQAIIALPFGLIIGSFLNVVIYRVPRGESVAFPGSHCGSCGTPIKPYDNIPVLSYLILRGRCRSCKSKISWRYPGVELLTGLLIAAAIYRDGLTWFGGAKAIFITILIALIFIDAEHYLLPDVITYPAFLFAIVSLLIATFSTSSSGTLYYPIQSWLPPFLQGEGIARWVSFAAIALAIPGLLVVDLAENILFGKYHDFDASELTVEEKDLDIKWGQQRKQTLFIVGIIGGVLQIIWWIVCAQSSHLVTGPASYIVLQSIVGVLIGGGTVWFFRAAFFYIRGLEGMGLGDIKLMAFIGAFLGWQSVLLVLFLGTLLGALGGGVAALSSKKGMKLQIPYGVPLGISALFVLFFGQPIIAWYLSKLNP